MNDVAPKKRRLRRYVVLIVVVLIGALAFHLYLKSLAPPEHVKPREVELDLRYGDLKRNETDPNALASAAGELRDDYGHFVELLEKSIAELRDNTSDANRARIRELTESAAWADFTRAKLLSEQMGQMAAGLAEVEVLLKKWAEVDSVVVAANQWKIQNLIDQNKIEEANTALDAFLKANEKNPAVGAGLIEQVIDGIRKAIDQAQAKSGDEKKLTSLRKKYLQTAEILYAPIKGKPIVIGGKIDPERSILTQLWIDALIQNDRAAEALGLAMECRGIFNKRRDAQAKIIDDKYAPRLRSCKAAIGLVGATKKLVKEYKDELKALAKDPGSDYFDPKVDSASVDGSVRVLKALRKNAPPKLRKRVEQTVCQELVTGYEVIIRRLKNLIPIELSVEWNTAKCLAATGKYDDSLEIYRRLIQLTDPQADKDSKRRFWRLQLEYCETYLKALRKDKERMRKLIDHIETELPKIGGDSLGGFKVQFFAIREKARRLSK